MLYLASRESRQSERQPRLDARGKDRRHNDQVLRSSRRQPRRNSVRLPFVDNSEFEHHGADRIRRMRQRGRSTGRMFRPIRKRDGLRPEYIAFRQILTHRVTLFFSRFSDNSFFRRKYDSFPKLSAGICYGPKRFLRLPIRTALPSRRNA